jgi:hypothetical protein
MCYLACHADGTLPTGGVPCITELTTNWALHFWPCSAVGLVCCIGKQLPALLHIHFCTAGHAYLFSAGREGGSAMCRLLIQHNISKIAAPVLQAKEV